MRNILPIIFVLLAAFSAFAKQSPGGESVDPFASKTAVSYFPRTMLPLPISLNKVQTYLQQQLPSLANKGITLALVAHKSSPGGEHYTFDQYYQGVPVFNSQVKVNIGLTGKVYSIFDNSYNTGQWSGSLTNSVAAFDAIMVSETLALLTGYMQANIQEQTVIAVIEGQPAAYKSLTLFDEATGDHKLFLLDKAGVIVYTHNLNAFSGVPASAYVFNPDPITSAETIYLAPYVDSSNANTAVLRTQRVLVNIDVEKVGSLYYLQNPQFVMSNFSAPNQTVVSSSTPAFLYTRADTAFEEVNAYYHLNVYQAYVASIGYSSLTTEQIQVDAHALNGSDNSQFSYGGGFPRLFFGDGGVDDAEDADVVVHEYGHALSYAGSPATNFGRERSAIDEGFGDYFAASYSRSISTYNWDKVFSWDGNNEYWNGRNAATGKIYPGDTTSSIHRNGEMWSTALMQVWSALGRDVADKLALETLFNLSSNMTFTDAALAYLDADDVLNGGVNYDLIHQIMVERGFLNGVGIETIDQAEASDFELLNTQGFTFNGESAILENHTGLPLSITVYDISGKAIKQFGNLVGSTHYLSGEQLAAGTYIVRVSAGNAVQIFRLVK
jgi:Zn-dependent metalloprotease